jgi:hypothetical protein
MARLGGAFFPPFRGKSIPEFGLKAAVGLLIHLHH